MCRWSIGKMSSNKNKPKEFSKQLIRDIRGLLWIVTIGGFLLALACIYFNYNGALPWITAMTGLPWSAHGVVCSFYLNMAKSDHSINGITFESAKANSFQTNQDVDC